MRLPGYRIPLDRDKQGRMDRLEMKGSALWLLLENKEVQARCLFLDPARRAVSAIAMTLVVDILTVTAVLATYQRRHRRVPR